MAFTRTQMVAAVAGTLSLAVLTGCPAAAPTAPSTGPSASAVPSMAPSTAPSGAASTTPSTTPSGGASVAPSTAPSGSAAPSTAPSAQASAPTPSGATVIVSGNVYDEEGATVDGALITVKSLNDSVPYTATATTTLGSWVVNNVPEGANVEVIASKDGWTSRRRVGSFQKNSTGQKNLINFGAAGGTADNDEGDQAGEAYFISDYPEIVSTEPVTDATGVDNQKLTFKVRLSEALDEDSRDSLEEALTILPANEEAAGTVDMTPADTTDPLDFETTEDANAHDGTHNDLGAGKFDLNADRTDTLTYFSYVIQEGSTFLGNSDRDVSATWNAEGTELTFSFDATLIADDSDEAKYQAVLVSQGNTGDDVIEDEEGNQLGTDMNGDLSSYPAIGQLIPNAFREKDLAAVDTLIGTTDRGETNWISTHDSAVNWEIKRDETDPTLKKVGVSKDVNGDFRIELQFSEGMAAFNNQDGGKVSAELDDLDNYRFALGDKTGDAAKIDLGDDAADHLLFTRAGSTPAAGVAPESGAAIDLRTTTVDYGNASGNELEREFAFANANLPAGYVIGQETTGVGDINVEVDDDDPTTVYIWVRGHRNLFDNTASEIKAYVENIEDPAGNSITENDAEDNQIVGSI